LLPKAASYEAAFFLLKNFCFELRKLQTERKTSYGPERKIWSGRAKKMIRKLKTGEFRIYSRHQDPKTGRRKNLGTFASRAKAEEHERAIQYFKRH
jgi:hypothetical protein